MNISYLATSIQVNNYLTGQGYEAASDPNFQDNINLYRLSAHSKICDYLGYEIITTDYIDEYYDGGSGVRKMYLNNRPVTALTTIKLDDVEVDRSDYKLVNGAYIFCPGNWFESGENIYSITYTAGYTQSTMPAVIRMAALKLIALDNAQIGGAGTTIGMSSISDGSGSSSSVDFEAEDRILKTLDKYRIW